LGPLILSWFRPPFFSRGQMKKSARDKCEPYLKIEHYQMNSASWTALSDRAVWLYLELRKNFNFVDGGDSRLKLPFSKVAWRMSRGSFLRGMAELEHYGFIKMIEHGGLFRKPSIYCLSMAWKDVSRQIVDKEGRAAIQLGMAKKRTTKDTLKNLIGHRRWET